MKLLEGVCVRLAVQDDRLLEPVLEDVEGDDFERLHGLAAFWRVMAGAYRGARDPERELRALRRWERRLAEDDEAIVRLRHARAMATEELGSDHAEALAALEQALDRTDREDPGAAKAARYADEEAVSHALESDPERARRLLARMHADDSTPEQRIRLALLRIRTTLALRDRPADVEASGYDLSSAIAALPDAARFPAAGWSAVVGAFGDVARRLTDAGLPDRANDLVEAALAAMPTMSSGQRLDVAERSVVIATIELRALRAAQLIASGDRGRALEEVSESVQLWQRVAVSAGGRVLARLGETTKELEDVAFSILAADPHDARAQLVVLRMSFASRGRELSLASDAQATEDAWQSFVLSSAAGCDRSGLAGGSLRGCMASVDTELFAIVGRASRLPSGSPEYWALVFDGAEMRGVGLGSETEVDRVASALLRDASDPFRDVAQSAREAYRTLLGPILGERYPETLGMSLPSALSRAPWEVALSPSGRRVAETLLLRRLPAPVALLQPAELDRSAGAVVLADPSGLDRTITSARRAAVRTVASPAGPTFTFLHGASGEGRHVADTYGAPLLTGPDATLAGLRDVLRQNDVWLAHFATHAVADASPYLLLSRDDTHDGHLRPREIVQEIDPAPALVVLSACETGAGDALASPTLNGLREAFLLAGAGAVVSTLWAVDDAASQRLMEQFHDRLASGEEPAEALREAQGTLRAMHDHPYYWAAFVMDGVVVDPAEQGEGP